MSEVVSLGLGLDSGQLTAELKKANTGMEEQVRRLNTKLEGQAKKVTQTIGVTAKNASRDLGMFSEKLSKLNGAFGATGADVSKFTKAFSGLAALGPALLNPWTALAAGIGLAVSAVHSFAEKEKAAKKEAAEINNLWLQVAHNIRAVDVSDAWKELDAFTKEHGERMSELQQRINLMRSDPRRAGLAGAATIKADQEELAGLEKLERKLRDVKDAQIARLAIEGQTPGAEFGPSRADAEQLAESRRKAEASLAKKAADDRKRQREAEDREELNDYIQHTREMFRAQKEFEDLMRTQAAQLAEEQKAAKQAEAEDSADLMRESLAIDHQLRQEQEKSRKDSWEATLLEGANFAEAFRSMHVTAAEAVTTVTSAVVGGIGTMITSLADQLGGAMAGVEASIGTIFGGFLSMIGATMTSLGVAMVAASFATLGVSAIPGAALIGIGALLSVAGGALSAGSRPSSKTPSGGSRGGGRSSGGRAPAATGFDGTGEGGAGGPTVINVVTNRAFSTSGAIARDVEDALGNDLSVRIGG